MSPINVVWSYHSRVILPHYFSYLPCQYLVMCKVSWDSYSGKETEGREDPLLGRRKGAAT